MRPLVSVITPTWQRPDDLLGAIANVREQTYRPLQHVVIVDGEDIASTSRADIESQDSTYAFDRADYCRLDFVELGRNWSSYLPNSFCAAPITVGMLVAMGEYQMWLADDERMDVDHIEGLVNALEAQHADFAYGRVRMYRPGQHPEDGYEIGHSPPSFGQITNVLYRVELLKHGLYPFGAGMASDWACIHRWIMYGASHVFVDRVTLSHRVDH